MKNTNKNNTKINNKLRKNLTQHLKGELKKKKHVNKIAYTGTEIHTRHPCLRDFFFLHFLTVHGVSAVICPRVISSKNNGILSTPLLHQQKMNLMLLQSALVYSVTPVNFDKETEKSRLTGERHDRKTFYYCSFQANHQE